MDNTWTPPATDPIWTPPSSDQVAANAPTQDSDPGANVTPVQAQMSAAMPNQDQQQPSPVASVTPQGDPNGIGSSRFSGFGQGVRDIGNSVIQKVAATAPDSVVQWLGHNYPHDVGPSETSDYHYKPEDILTMIRNQGAEYEANKKSSDRADSWDLPRLGGQALTMGTGAGELGPILGGAVGGAMQPNYNAHDAEDVGIGTAESAGTGAALGYGLNKVAGFLSPKVNKAIKEFTDRGVYPTIGQIGQLSNTWIGKLPAAIEEGYSRLPFIGGFVRGARDKSVADVNMMAYNDALAPISRSVDKNAKPGLEGLQDVATKIDDAYDTAKANLRFKPDQDYIDNKIDIDDKLSGDTTHLQLPNGQVVPNPDAGMGAFDKPLRDLYHRVTGAFSHAASNANEMDGKTLVQAQSVLKTTIDDLSSGDANHKAMGRLLTEFNKNVNDSLERTNSPRALADLNKAHESYALYQRLVDAATAGKNNGFIFTPNQYMNSVARWSGKNQLARGEAINQHFATSASDLFKNTIRDSGTPGGNEFRHLLHKIGDVAERGGATATAGAAGLAAPALTGAAYVAPLLTHNDVSRKLIAKMVAGDRPVGSEQMSELFKTAAPFVSGPTGNALLGNDNPPAEPHFADGGSVDDQTNMALDRLSDDDKAYNARQALEATASLSRSDDRNSLASYPTDTQASVYPLSGSSLADSVKQGMNRPMDNSEGNLDYLANVAQRTAPTSNPDVAPLMHTAYALSKNNAIAALGFDPSQTALDMSPGETNLGGFYDPDKDIVFAKGKTNPESIVHESIHRGINSLKASGMLTKDELALVGSPGDQESAVRYIMATRMGDPDNNPKFDVGQAQRNHGINSYMWHEDNRKLLNNIELKAARLLGVKQLEDAKQTPKNVDGQMQNLLNVANTGAQ